MNDLSLAILGGGNMGRALIGGLIARGVARSSIAVSEISAERRTALARDLGIRVFDESTAAVAGARVLILAVKPQDARATLDPLASQLDSARPVLLSVAAGVRVSVLQRLAGPNVPIVRAMPNRPALVGAGVTGLYAPPHVVPDAREVAERVMRALGEVVWVATEDELDVVTALSGSGPAYFFLLAELMCRAAVDLGLEPTAARTLAVQCLYGAGQLAVAGVGDLARLREEVTSRGGTTEAALRVYEAADLRGIVARALADASQRSRDLSDSIS
jgi:pyrroline-5-carboxylate reductase